MFALTQDSAPGSGNKSSRKRRHKTPRPSLGTPSGYASEMSPATPLNRFAAQRNHNSFSPFSALSSQGSPRPSQLPASPSVVLFSGPADRGFERVHDDTFPQDVGLLKNLARTKFKIAPSADIEMSYVNPNGIVCDLDDEYDLKAFAAHAAISQSIKVNVTSSTNTSGNSQPPNANGSVGPSQQVVNGTGAMLPPPSTSRLIPKTDPITPKRPAQVASTNGAPTGTAQTHASRETHPSAAPETPQSNGRRKRKAAPATPATPQAQAESQAAPVQSAAAASEAGSGLRWEDREPPASLIARLWPSSDSQSSSDVPKDSAQAASTSEAQAHELPSTPQPDSAQTESSVPATTQTPSQEPAVAKRATNKRKRADKSPSPTSSAPAATTSDAVAPPSPTEPAPKKPRGRPKKSIAAAADSGASATSDAAVNGTSATTAIPPIVPATSSEDSASRIVGEEQPPEAPTKRVRASRAKQNAPVPDESSVVQPDPTEPSESAKESGEAVALAAPADPPVSTQPPESPASSQLTPANTKRQEVAQTSDTPKRRGRPPKAAQQNAEDGSEAVAAAEIVEATSTPKPRGRPSKKAAVDVEASAEALLPATEASTPAKTSKQRGRPPKKAAVNADAGEEVPAPAVEPPANVAEAADTATEVPLTAKRTSASRKTRASNAKAAKAATEEEESSTCVVCGASPDHQKEECPIYKGDSQAILESLAIIRKKGKKTKKEKEASTLLYSWLSEKFGVNHDDTSFSQDTTQASQASAISSTPQPPVDTSALLTQTSEVSEATSESTQAPTGEAGSNLTAPDTQAARPLTAAQKRQAAKKNASAKAASEAQLPPPSGVEASPRAPKEATTPASPEKPAAKTTRGKAAKKTASATAAVSATQESEPRIALTPSSPAQSSVSPSQDVADRLRASSESSEAELATSPLLSAAPREHGDMDVDPLPSQSNPKVKDSAAQQLEERRRKMKMADKGVPSNSLHDLVEGSKGSRATSASVTSSDSSHNGKGSDSESESDTEDEAEAATSKPRGGAAGKSSKKAATAIKASRPLAAPSQIERKSADKAGSSSDSDSSSSSSSSESSSESGSESEPESDSDRDTQAQLHASSKSTAGLTNATPATTRQRPPAANPFLRGLTPLSTTQSNGSLATPSQKAASFTRLQDLKPTALRQNSSQPGSPMSTPGGLTPLSASAPFFSSQPAAATNGGSGTNGTLVEESESEIESSSSEDSSEDEDPRTRGKKGAAAGAASNRAGGKAATPASAKAKKSIFAMFS